MYLILLASPLTYYSLSKYHGTWPETRCLKRKLEFYRERAKKYANTPRKSFHAESTKKSIDRMKKQWEKWEPNYVENEVHSNGSLDFVLSLRLPPLLTSLLNILSLQYPPFSMSSLKILPLNTFPSQHLLLSNINISLSQ